MGSYFHNNRKCALCGEKGSSADPITIGHIIPRSRGGPDIHWNYRPEHKSCNEARGTEYTREDAAEAIRRRAAWEARQRSL